MNNYELQRKRLEEFAPAIMDIVGETDAVIAGGAIRSVFCSEDINDIDIYPSNAEEALSLYESLNNNATSVAFSSKSITFFHSAGKDKSVLVQLIIFDYFKDVADLFNTFDFTCCMGAYSPKYKKFILHDDFLADNLAKSLNFNMGTRFPLMSLVRLKKYTDKGFTVSKREVFKMGLAANSIKIDSWKDAVEHIGGMYGVIPEKLFDESKPFSLSELVEQMDKLEKCETSTDVSSSPAGDFVIRLSILKKKTKCVLIANGEYYLGEDSLCFTKELYDANKQYFELVDKPDFLPEKLYKFVKIRNDKLVSFYDPNFAYNIGEITPSTSHGLYFATRENLGRFKNSYHSKSSNSVVIEVSYDHNDILEIDNYSKFIRITKCKVLRIVPPAEVVEILGPQNKDDDTPF